MRSAPASRTARALAFALAAAATAATAAGSTAHATDVRGALTGFEALQPSPPPEAGTRAAFYWEEPNGALDVRRPRANPEHDFAVVLTGPNVPEMSLPAVLNVAGGRCRPGSVVLAPNATLRVQNQDWMPHEFFVTAAGSAAPIASFGPELTAPRSDRQGQIAAAGRYELRDRRQPTFRCFLLVGEGQGRVGRVGADGAYSVPLPANADGAYTLRVYFEGRVVAEAPVRPSEGRDTQGPPLPVNAAPAAPANGASASPSNAPSGASAAPANPAASAAPDQGGRHRRGDH